MYYNIKLTAFILIEC